jgi:hypothetical protein
VPDGLEGLLGLLADLGIGGGFPKFFRGGGKIAAI